MAILVADYRLGISITSSGYYAIRVRNTDNNTVSGWSPWLQANASEISALAALLHQGNVEYINAQRLFQTFPLHADNLEAIPIAADDAGIEWNSFFHKLNNNT